MGALLADVLHDNQMEVLNDGTPAFHKGTYRAALDITAAIGVHKQFSLSWSVINDDIKPDHSPVLLQVGEPHITAKIMYKD